MELARAVTLQKAGDLEGAADVYRGLLAKVPDLVPALCLLANIERQRGDFKRAAAYLRRALELAPQGSAALQESGLLALARGKAEEAVPYLRRLVSVRPDNPDGHFNLGHALERAHLPEQAIAAYRSALEIGVRQPWEAQTRIGSCLVVLGREPEASEFFDKALSLAPDFAPALFGKGMVMMAYGDFEQAGRLFEAALAADPARTEIYQQVVELRKFDNMDEPLVHRMQALLQEPGGSPHTREKLLFALGKVANDCAEYDLAFEHYSAAKALKKARQPPFERASFDELVTRIKKAFASLPEGIPMAGRGGPVPVFIIGMPRSGTTLVEQILSCHSQVNGAGEQAFMEQLSRRPQTNYPEGVASLGAGWAEDAREAYLREISPFADGARFVTDKYPGNFMHVGLIASLFPEARFIHCRRNPLDTCVSIFFQDFSTGNYYANDLEDIAFYYAGYARLMRHWEAVCGARLQTVQYEHMVAEQEKESRALLRFLGLDWEATCLQFHKNPRKVSTMSRWQVRQPVYTGSLERWRRYERHLDALLDALPES